MKIKKIAEDSGYIRCSCPFCGADYFVVKDGEFSCFACEKHGKITDIGPMLQGKVTVFPKAYTKDDELLFSMNKEAALFFFKKLKEKNPGSEYLKERKLTADDAMNFGLGYAPDTFTSLYDVMSKRHSDEELLSSGLFRKGKDGKLYDFFRGRLMFPIMNEKGNVIAFGGRIIGNEGPKYLNSSESPVFSKKENLYGFPYKDKPGSDAIFICEGYMDLIALKKAGIKDSAGVLGTALTKEHAKLIASRYKKVCLGLDSDAAGMNAVKRSVKVLKGFGLTVTVPDFKPAKDPDEFLRRFGAEKLKKRLNEAVPVKRFLAAHTDGDELLDVLMES